MMPLRPSWQGTSRHQIGITYGIQPEDERKHFPQEKRPSCHGGYATDEEHYTLHELSIVELPKAADKGQGRSDDMLVDRQRAATGKDLNPPLTTNGDGALP